MITYLYIGTRMYYDEADGLPENCNEIILLKALLELHFPRHSVQRFSHMFDLFNLYHTKSSKGRIATCTSIEQDAHIDYFVLLPSILNLHGKANRESIFDNLPLSFVIGIDDDVSLRFHTKLNDDLLHKDINDIFSLNKREFKKRYEMISVPVKPGQILMFAGM